MSSGAKKKKSCCTSILSLPGSGNISRQAETQHLALLADCRDDSIFQSAGAGEKAPRALDGRACFGRGASWRTRRSAASPSAFLTLASVSLSRRFPRLFLRTRTVLTLDGLESVHFV